MGVAVVLISHKMKFRQILIGRDKEGQSIHIDQNNHQEDITTSSMI